jgi:hypothetical protein
MRPMTSRDRYLLFGLAAVTLALAAPTRAGVDGDVLLAVPVLLFARCRCWPAATSARSASGCSRPRSSRRAAAPPRRRAAAPPDRFRRPRAAPRARSLAGGA